MSVRLTSAEVHLPNLFQVPHRGILGGQQDSWSKLLAEQWTAMEKEKWKSLEVYAKKIKGQNF